LDGGEINLFCQPYTRAREIFLNCSHKWVCRATLGVRFLKAKLNTPSAATELVEHRPGQLVHGAVSKEPADRIERAILVVDTIIINLDPVLTLDSMAGHGLIFPLGGHAARALPAPIALVGSTKPE
jgi:hypothetical protein